MQANDKLSSLSEGHDSDFSGSDEAQETIIAKQSNNEISSSGEENKSMGKPSLKEKIAAKTLTNQLRKIQKLSDAPEEINGTDGFQMNQKIKIGLILLLAGIILGLLIHILGGIVALIGLVFIVLGLLEM